MHEETCDECGRVDHPAYMCWRVGHIQKGPAMTANQYQREALRTATSNPHAATTDARLANFALGLTGEAGEVADALKKHLFHGKPLDSEALLLELGDCAWYLATLAHELGFTLDEVFARNVQKLRARFPDGFSTQAANERKDEK